MKLFIDFFSNVRHFRQISQDLLAKDFNILTVCEEAQIYYENILKPPIQRKEEKYPYLSKYFKLHIKNVQKNIKQ